MTSAPPSRLAKWLSRSIATLLWLGVAFIIFVAFYLKDMPDTQGLSLGKPRASTILYADGSPLLAQSARFIPVAELSPLLIKAVIATEDRRFYHHWGIDPRGIARALRDNWRGEALSGGSTITQQLAKNLFLSPERTMGRKLREGLLALWLEMRYSKDEILTFYLNRVYLGAGSYGVEAAAQRYFGHSATQVTLPEAALLAGLLKAPSKYAPTTDAQASTDRLAVVLQAMTEEGYITPAQQKAALAQPVARKASRRVAGDSWHTGYFADYVETQAQAILTLQGNVDPHDVVIYSTLLPQAQQAAAASFTNLSEQSVRQGTQAALVAMQPSGAIVAMLGGRSYASGNFNRATQAMRQPGSTFKTFVYASAFEHGASPDDAIDDKPINYSGFTPKNHDDKFLGRMTLREAFAQSRNSPAVQLAAQVGVEQVRDVAMRFGIVSPLHNNLSLALGSSEVSLLELTAAYAPLAAKCKVPTPYAINQIVQRSTGKTLYQYPANNDWPTAVSPSVCGQLTDILRAVVHQGTGRKAAIAGTDVIGKTGTSSAQRDAWFVGITPRLVAGVWLGRDDNSVMGSGGTGGNLAARLWQQFALQALPSMPAGVVESLMPSAAPVAPMPEPSSDPAPSLDSLLDQALDEDTPAVPE